MNPPGGTNRKFYKILFIFLNFKTLFLWFGTTFSPYPTMYKHCRKRQYLYSVGKKAGILRLFYWLWELEKLEIPAFSEVFIGCGTSGSGGLY